jgi:hypothetical protein
LEQWVSAKASTNLWPSLLGPQTQAHRVDHHPTQLHSLRN